MPRNIRYASTPIRFTNEMILIILALYFYRYDLYSKFHEKNNLSREYPQMISHVDNNIQLYIEIIHTF
jgi:hypothetical protein